MKVKMKGEEHILVNFPIDTSLKKKAHSAVCVHQGGSLYIPTSNAKEINRTTGNIPIKRRLPRRTEFVCGFKVLLNG